MCASSFRLSVCILRGLVGGLGATLISHLYIHVFSPKRTHIGGPPYWSKISKYNGRSNADLPSLSHWVWISRISVPFLVSFPDPPPKRKGGLTLSFCSVEGGSGDETMPFHAHTLVLNKTHCTYLTYDRFLQAVADVGKPLMHTYHMPHIINIVVRHHRSLKDAVLKW